ncbi:unnamed protein product [Caenorhabditis angaria]|uniref:Basement membrane proteoglycan n=1 Tax=Caenorhabditis angaria TaxID=860376 RepID=A0A9P1MVN0_9PELO|nr:unnamed protein product [Caenorhabditis angaria]
MKFVAALVLCLMAVHAARHHRKSRQTYQDVDDYDYDANSQKAQEHQDPVTIQITVFPTEKEVREGRDVSFECRARTSDNSAYPSTSWTREGGPLPRSAHDSGSQLTINPVALSDAGTYICIATHNGQTVEAKAVLTVVTYGPQTNGLRPQGQCERGERTCANGIGCYKDEFVCDGERDCEDGTDEQNCGGSSSAAKICEPNEFKCNNNRCVQKMWLCDGDDDCGDQSDEQNCHAKSSADGCKPTEFQCQDRRKCVPSSFHCDGTNDCDDGSDEIGCVQPTVVEPPRTNIEVPRDTTFTLNCKAVGVPEPYINWRLNWGPVCEPPRCLQTSEGGYGTLTIHNAQPVDQGAYTCEAINVKGRVLATPDCIVRVVEQPFPTRPPPTPPAQIAKCDTTGSVSPYPNHYGQCECKPQVTGPNCDQCKPGSFHLSPKSPEGCLKCFCFGITNQCRSSGYYRTKDAACDRLMFAGDSEGVTISDVEERTIERQPTYSYSKTGYLTFEGTTDGLTKYWRLPQRFLGDKVTSYGGKMEFEIEFSGSGSHNGEPMVVLKGNQNILVHRVRNQEQVLRSDSPVRITVETYETNYEQLNGAPATREDLLMVLADLDSFLIRATHVDQQTSTSLGDVSWEIAVDRQTQDGLALEVEQCSCPPGYIGTSCEDCAPGYERSGHGPYLGTCVPQQRQQQCGTGAVQPTTTGQCQCKAAVTGPNCDRCAANAFGLSPSNPQGCIPCFCSGVTQQCSASNWRRTVVSIDYSRGDRDQLELTSADTKQPFSPQSHAEVTGQQIEFRSFNEARGQTLYWKLSEKFLGNKVTAYGGSLKYTFKFSGNGNPDNGADVILKGNDIALQFKSRQPIHADRENTIEIQLFENHWQRVDGQQATREHLLMALADLDTLLIKASYNDDSTDSSLISVNFEFAEPHGRGITAAEVEQCMCPPGYVGTSCEDCAPGYSRTGGGLYLGLCEKCECNGHASQCDKEYGYCLDCQHNTEGDQCERCKPGFVGDARRGTPQDCQPAATRAPCHCNNHSPRGCDSFGRCLLCEHSTEGTQCERCKKGYYGDATKGTPYDCTPCPCPGASDCYLDSEGQVACRICPAGLQGKLCNECAPGYTRSNKPAGRVCEPIGQVNPGDITFVPRPNEALRVRILEPKHQIADVGESIHWVCQVVSGFSSEHINVEWSKVGEMSLPPNARSYDGYLVLEGIEKSNYGHYRCIATTITQYATDDAWLTVQPRQIGRPPQPVIEPPHLVVDEGDAAQFRCYVPGIPDCQITWHREILGGILPHGVYQTGNALKIPQAQIHHAGKYICSATNIYGTGQSTPAVLEVKRRAIAPKVDPPRQVVDRDQPARFKCWVPGNSNVQLKWTRADGSPLPQGAQEQQGILHISRTTEREIGQYKCTATDPNDNIPRESEPVDLSIRDPGPPAAPQVDPPVQTVNVNDPAQFRCWVAGQPRAQLKWARKDGRPLPQGIMERDGYLRIDRSQLNDAGDYECSYSPPNGGQPIPAPPARLNVNQPRSIQPLVDPPTQTVNENEPSRIRCWVDGHPNIQLQWVKRGRRPLPGHARVSQGHLEISRTQKSDEDDYICIATDPTSNRPVESTPARINVRSPLRPIIEPNEQTVPQGNPFRIRCYVPGHPNIPLTFRKTAGNLNDDNDQEDGVFTVARAELTDEGDYICTARDPSTGQPVDSTPATVHVTPPSPGNLETRPLVPTIRPSEQIVKEGEPARIECEVQGNPHAGAYLSFERIDGRSLPFGSSDSSGVLTIPSATLSDAGNYICIYRPENNKPSKTSPSVLKVTRAGTPPNPVATPPLLRVAPGAPAQFHCEPNSDTPARIKWFHSANKNPLPEGVVQNGEDIFVSEAGDDNIGEYICTAENEFGSGESQPVRLEVTDVQEPPTAEVVPRVWNGNPGERHQFRCIVTGSPTPKITWTGPNGTPLSHDVSALEPNILDFSNGRSELNGNYTCTASNPIGEASDVGVVNIGPSLTIKTNPPGPKLIVTVGEPVNIRCEAFGAPGEKEPEVEWLHDPGPERGDLPDDFKPVTISEQFIRHPSIGLGNAGLYTCKGTSEHATATKNIIIEVVEPSKIATVTILGGSKQKFVAGRDAELVCTSTGNSLIDRLEWSRPDAEISSDVEDHNENGILHFATFKNGYAGEYVCNGYRNDVLIASATVEVLTEGQSVDEPIVSNEKPNVRIVNQGENIVLKCSSEDFENGENYKWALLRDGSLVRQLGSEPTLEINKANPSNDYGVYRCNVEDNNGHVEGSAFTAVAVGYEQSNSVDFKFEEKSDAVLTCPVFQVPGSKVEWTWSLGDLPSNAHPNGNKIEIKDFDDSVAGIYICKVSIDGNDINGYVNAQILVPDTIIQVLLEVSSESPQIGDRAWFDCKVTGDPSAVITWNRESSNEELPANAQVTGGRLLFTGLKEEDAGVYKCIAKTKAGPLQTRTVLNIGSGKRKRKHLGARRGGRRLMRHPLENVPLPVVYTVGDEAYLQCLGSTETNPNQTATWTKADGEIPATARIEQGVLIVPIVNRGDEGKYICTIETNVDKSAEVSQIDLQVDDYIPEIHGEPIELPPLTDSEISNFNIRIIFNASDPKGVIFGTQRIKSGDLLDDTNEKIIFHEARLETDGTVRYEFETPAGKEVIVTSNKFIPNEWNVIEVKNDGSSVKVLLNDETTIKQHSYPLPSLRTGVNQPLYIGGKLDGYDEQDNFDGVISQVVLNGQNLHLGVARVPETTVKFDVCLSNQPCLNNGKCRNTNNNHGFVCECEEKFFGDVCQFRTNRCHDEFCNTGICLDNEDTWQCVCPIGTTGLRCEETLEVQKPIGFSQETSFIVVKKPVNLEKIRLKVKPNNDNDEHLLVYFGNKYGPRSNEYVSLSLVANQVVLTVKQPDQHEVTRIETEPLEPGKMFDVSLTHNENILTMEVNGEIVEKLETSHKMNPETGIFVGGLPPGLTAPPNVVEKSLSGCVYEIYVNAKTVELEDLSSSGDITNCDESQWEPEETTTTTTTTEEPIETTEEVTTTTEESYNIYETSRDSEPVTIIPPTTNTPPPPTAVILPTDSFEEEEEEITTESPYYDSATPIEGTLETIENGNKTFRNDLCPPGACGNEGICIQQNETHYECQCKIYYDGPTCNVFRPIEHAARFDGNAFLEFPNDDFPHLTSEKDEVLSFKMKTRSPNGLIIWQGQHPSVTQMEDYLSVGIVNGYLHYSYELGGGAAHMISRERVDDGKIHHIRIERRGQRGLLKVDNYEDVPGRSTGILAMLNVDGNIFIGGVPDIQKSTGGIFNRNFVGCIADVDFNGILVDLMESAIDGKNVKPCEEWVHRKRWLYRRRFL